MATAVLLEQAATTVEQAKQQRKRKKRDRRSLEAPLLGLLGILLVCGLFELCPRLGIVDARYMPPTSEILVTFFSLLTAPAFWIALLNTIITWATGLTVAMLAGVGLGMLIGSFPVVREFTASTIEFLRPIPSVALIPLVVLLLGTDRPPTLVLVIYAAFWQILLQVLYGVADVDPVAKDTARCYQFSFLRKGLTVVWPTAMPYVVTGFRLASTVALVLTLTGELLIGTPGLGQQIFVAQSSGAVPRMYALIMVAGLLGVLVNLLARFVETKYLFWHPSIRKDTQS